MKKFKALIAGIGLAVVSLAALAGCSASFSYVYENGEKYTAGDRDISDKIENINIDYMSGNVTLVGTSTDAVSIRETTNKEIEDKKKVHTWVDGGTLYVRYCASGRGFNFDNIEKNLEITIPEDVKLSNVKVDISSGGFTGSNFEADSLDADASSGGINANCSAKNIKLDVSSGSIVLNQKGLSDLVELEASSGHIDANVETVTDMSVNISSGKIALNAKEVKTFKSNASSGDSQYTFLSVPESSVIGSSSGDIDIFIPEDADVAADVSVSSGDIRYDLPFTKEGKAYKLGNGKYNMKISASSGDITIKKAEAEK